MTSTRPFSCSECSQTFTRNENLERHRRSRHGDDSRRPFECLYCQTRFSRRDVCKRHTRRCSSRISPKPASTDRADGDKGLDNAASPPTPPIPSFSPLALTDVIIVDPGLSVENGDSPIDALKGPSPSEPASSTSAIEDHSAQSAHMAAYFEYFHPSFPLLHRPTIGDDTPRLLRDIITAIGSLYTAQNLSEEDAVTCVQWSQSLWDAGRKELSRLVGADWRELRRTWIMQAWLLHIIYGAYMGGAARYGKAKIMLRSLVDAAQDLGLLKQTVATSVSRVWIKAGAEASQSGDAQALHASWMMYVNEESMKLSMYTLLFLDFHILAPCNVRPLISPIELDWELPLPRSLWESDTAMLWLGSLKGEFQFASLLELDESLGFPCPASRSLTLATQSIMSEVASPSLLAALSASPIATLFVLTSIDSFIRDLTRCYYQFPPGLADPSAFHIFTQSQNKQISAALRHVLGVISKRDMSCDESDRPIWTSIERMALSVKIALYKPDDLLIGGIVDSSIVAGLATATHLTLGLYAGARRGQQCMSRPISGDDAILVILDEAMEALSLIRTSDRQAALHEAPWSMVASYRILLAIWRSLRWAAGEVRRRQLSQTSVHRRFEASVVIFNSIMEVLWPQQDQEIGNAKGGLICLPDEGEMYFTKSVLWFWKERNVWAVGPCMVTVLDEAISVGY
ncbi:hypothetical protein BGZ61DRAFT_143294 [Ilyonectria robusta]|uniref:uncharacterized protein n=1 Tax=Ilyonectria robusta TaxID=1079257 RepID=UPI001E8DB4BF|nr:uncharacterized protein BGZ61DRAFT_143294 [Ilyonectria robusta]KAH8663334.1 hypothetical protein BGZ61DRAFT_143294 [Ilyonectria robusta]